MEPCDEDAEWLRSLSKYLQSLKGTKGTLFMDGDKDRLERIANRLSDSPEAVTDEMVTVMREALTPSAETKAAYIGEFSFPIESDGGDDRWIDVPWTTIKEIMAAIRERAGLSKVSPLIQETKSVRS